VFSAEARSGRNRRGGPRRARYFTKVSDQSPRDPSVRTEPGRLPASSRLGKPVAVTEATTRTSTLSANPNGPTRWSPVAWHYPWLFTPDAELTGASA
jgi:hypothetical protein